MSVEFRRNTANLGGAVYQGGGSFEVQGSMYRGNVDSTPGYGHDLYRGGELLGF